MIMWIVRGLLSVFGFSVSPVLVGAILASVVMLGVGWFTLHIYNKGKASCEYAHLLATIKEKDRQLKESELIQQRDSARAETAEKEMLELKRKVDETPKNDTICLDRDGAGRIRSIGSGVRNSR